MYLYGIRSNNKVIKDAIDNLNLSIKELLQTDVLQAGVLQTGMNVLDTDVGFRAYTVNRNKKFVRELLHFVECFSQAKCFNFSQYNTKGVDSGEWLVLQCRGEYDKLNHTKSNVLEFWIMLFYVELYVVNENNLQTLKNIVEVLDKRRFSKCYQQRSISPLTLEARNFVVDEISLRAK